MRREIELTDGSVLLRPYRVDDIDNLYQAIRESITEISKWMSWCHEGYSIEENRAWIEARAEAWAKGTDYDFIITSAMDGFLIGGCGLRYFDYNYRIAELGYWVRTSRTKKGVATAATRLLAQFGFKELELNRIEIVVAVGNKISQRVAEKAGATREGILRNRLFIREQVHDAVMFSLIPGDLASTG